MTLSPCTSSRQGGPLGARGGDESPSSRVNSRLEYRSWSLPRLLPAVFSVSVYPHSSPSLNPYSDSSFRFLTFHTVRLVPLSSRVVRVHLDPGGLSLPLGSRSSQDPVSPPTTQVHPVTHRTGRDSFSLLLSLSNSCRPRSLMSSQLTPASRMGLLSGFSVPDPPRRLRLHDLRTGNVGGRKRPARV